MILEPSFVHFFRWDRVQGSIRWRPRSPRNKEKYIKRKPGELLPGRKVHIYYDIIPEPPIITIIHHIPTMLISTMLHPFLGSSNFTFTFLLVTLYLAQPITSNKVREDYFSFCFYNPGSLRKGDSWRVGIPGE
jgi:hypothetical protein